METQLPGLYDQVEIKHNDPITVDTYNPRIREVMEFGVSYRERKEHTDALTNMYKGVGFWEYEIPEEAPQEVIDENFGIERTEKLSRNERIKARREYSKKRETTIKRLKIVGDYVAKRDQEENEIDIQGKDNYRDEFHAAGILDTKEEREGFLNAAKKQDSEQYRKYIEEIFRKLSSVDLKMFELKKDEDIFKDYEKKMRYIKAGFVMKNLLMKYLESGGVMDDNEYLEKLGLIAFYERQHNLYARTREILLHPQYMLIRDEDMKNMTPQKLQDRLKDVDARLNGIPAEQKNSPTAHRLKNIKNYLEKIQARYDLQQAGAIAKLNVDPAVQLKEAVDERKAFGLKQWTTNIKSLLDNSQTFDNLMHQVFKEGNAPSIPEGVWTRAGLSSRAGTRTDIVKLVYMKRYNKTVEDLLRIADPKNKQDEKDLEDFKAVAKEIEDKLGSQKPLPKTTITDQNNKTVTFHDSNYTPEDYSEDIKTMASIMEEMIEGALNQFSVVDGKANYMQFDGLAKPMGATIVLIPTAKWGKTAAITRELSLMIKNINQIMEADENISRLALSRFRPEQLELLQQIFYYSENVSLPLLRLANKAKQEGFQNPAATPEELRKKLQDTEEPMALGIQIQVLSYFMRSFYAEEKEMFTRGCNMEFKIVDGVKKSVPSPESWKLPLGIGYSDCINGALTTSTDVKEIEAVFTSELGKQDSDNFVKNCLKNPYVVLTNKFSIPFEQDGTVKAPAGF